MRRKAKKGTDEIPNKLNTGVLVSSQFYFPIKNIVHQFLSLEVYFFSKKEGRGA